MLEVSPEYCVLICTRNRPAKLTVLLESLCVLTKRPNQVIIVSSGQSIQSSLEEFKGRLEILHKHIEGRGQIRQKMEGVKLIDPINEWVAFLDDDLVLNFDAIENVFSTISQHEASSRILGVGLCEESLVHKVNNLPRRFVSNIFGINTNSLGAVLPNGQNNSYMASKVVIQTSWLNGASFWRRNIAETYSFPFLEAKYSICEDLIFSYKFSKIGILLFDPNSKYASQDGAAATDLNDETFRALTYWRLYFVLTNKELSVSAFLWAQIGRSLNYAIVGNLGIFKKCRRLLLGVRILSDVCMLLVRNIPPVEILELKVTGS